MTSDPELADDLFKVAERTTDDGRVEVQIQDVSERGGSYLRVTAQLPHGGEMAESFEYPERDSSEYKFVRLVERAGYVLSAIDELEGTYVEAEKRGEDWTFYAPKTTTRRERLRGSVSKLRSPLRSWSSEDSKDGFWFVFFLSPALIFIHLFATPFTDHENEFVIGYGMAVWHLTLWVLFAAAVWYLTL